MQLDEAQRRAVETCDGPVCIKAGPGSGKTFTIVERIAHLIEQKGVSPEHILAITFTNKAADELRERITRRLNGTNQTSVVLPWIGTFHALAHWILTREGEKTYVAMERQQHEILSEALKQFPDIPKRDALRRVSVHKCAVAAGEAGAMELAVLAQAYDSLMHEYGFMDFDDLLISVTALLRDRADARRRYQHWFQYVMVDEYQDTNRLQAILLELLVGAQGNVCIIGDPDQAIYGFRGATRENFFDFTKRYPSAETIALTTNYRSRPNLIAAGRALLASAYGNGKHSQIEDGGGANVYVVTAADEREEVRYIASAIRKSTGGFALHEASDGAYHLGDIAVLYRTNAIGERLARGLERENIPQYHSGAKPLVEYREIRGVIELLEGLSPERPLVELVGHAIEQWLLSHASGDETQSDYAQRRLYQLSQRALLLNDLPPPQAKAQFLREAQLSREEDDRAPIPDAVQLMTAHAAKGLEFPIVIIVGVEEGLFPHQSACVTSEYTIGAGDIEEERRLLYVALTRAKDEAHLLCCANRFLHGARERRLPSRFLRDLPEEYIERRTPEKRRRKPQAKLF